MAEMITMNCTLTTHIYGNGRIALRLMEDNGEEYGMLSTNIVDVELDEDMITVPVWKLRPEILDSQLATGKFEVTGLGVRTGHSVAPVWRVICPDLLAKAGALRNAAVEGLVSRV
ncbi:hypothetical protein ACI77O_12280 [Pseudomonas tritici]|uniref:hypothetical protein n=1 Tax=Pseudomonas tritici TaxID=2745518 RepID=UPI00387B8D93